MKIKRIRLEDARRPALPYGRKRRGGGAAALTLFAAPPPFSTHKPFMPPCLRAN
jgi:hypothetical protein